MDENKKDAAFTAQHQTVWQFIKFVIVAAGAGITETVSFFILMRLLPSRFPQDFDFFVFHYTQENELCRGAFIAFFASAVLAEIVSFLVNRKTTFKANNNMLANALMYTVLALSVICLKTWMVTVLTKWISGLTDVQLLIEWVPKGISMLVAMLIIFPMNKFVIMRHKDDPAEPATE
ncbi:MAG: GtrA family protein [Clostridia bacterium]|nr:GtrA family protein [Clostridia bacterium]